MTEAMWLIGADPNQMLDSLSATATIRKLSLFGAACCRRVWHLITDERIRTCLEVAERFIEGDATGSELERAGRSAEAVFGAGRVCPPWIWSAATTLQAFVLTRVADRVGSAGWFKRRAERRWQCNLLRDLFGPLPFRPVVIDPDWQECHDGSVARLAQAMYDERAFDELPILADSLEDAGCDNADILAHCRSGGEHVRGCWVVDLVLGKS